MQDFSLYPIFPFEWLIKNIAHQKMTNKSDDYPKVKKFLSEKSILPNFTHSRKIQNKSFFFRFFQREMKFLSFQPIITRMYSHIHGTNDVHFRWHEILKR